MNDDLITIIVPVYNISEYLEKCIESIIQQTYSDLQIILVDDGSTDVSLDICNRYAKKNHRIEVLHKTNGGLVSARKAGLRLAKGTYIGFVDGDDFIEKEMYEELVQCMQSSHADFVHSDFYFGEGHMEVRDWNPEDEVYHLEKNHAIEFLEKYIISAKGKDRLPASIWSKLFRAEYIKKCYEQVPDSLSYGEDEICLFYCVLEADTICYKKKAYYHYIKRENSIMNNHSDQRFFKELKLYECLCNVGKQFAGNDLSDALSHQFQYKVIDVLNESREDEYKIPKYRFPSAEKLFYQSVLLYGAGNVGKDYYNQLSKYQQIDISAWADKHFERCQFPYFKVTAVSEIKLAQYDFILIAVLEEKQADEIRKELLAMGVDMQKIIWERPQICF